MNLFIFYSEAQPIFAFRAKIVQAERRTKWTCSFFICSISRNRHIDLFFTSR